MSLAADDIFDSFDYGCMFTYVRTHFLDIARRSAVNGDDHKPRRLSQRKSKAMSGQKRNNNDFLSSMTFAGGGLMRDCDCDECEFVPASIREAIRQHKRLKTSSSLTRTQDRSLVARENTISVWKLTMPVDAEPLIEFGGSHRIVLIDTLSSVSV
jgi:hypothetical protein